MLSLKEEKTLAFGKLFPSKCQKSSDFQMSKKETAWNSFWFFNFLLIQSKERGSIENSESLVFKTVVMCLKGASESFSQLLLNVGLSRIVFVLTAIGL